jgi:hypothetical protein
VSRSKWEDDDTTYHSPGDGIVLIFGLGASARDQERENRREDIVEKTSMTPTITIIEDTKSSKAKKAP